MPLAIVSIVKADILMSDKQTIPTIVSDRALEMAMRDVIGSMCEFSLESGFQPTDGDFEIIEIYPADNDNSRSGKERVTKSADSEESEVLQFPDLRRAG